MPSAGILNLIQLTYVREFIDQYSSSFTKVGISPGGNGYAGTLVPFFASFTSESEFVVSGTVGPGYPDRSWLYRALKTYGDINSMPKTGTPLSHSEEDDVSKWILGIGLP